MPVYHQPHSSSVSLRLILAFFGSPPAPEAWGGGCGSVEERAGTGADAHGQHDAGEGGGVRAPQEPIRAAAGQLHYLRGEARPLIKRLKPAVSTLYSSRSDGVTVPSAL